MDTVHFGPVFAFTAVDIFSRDADVLLRPSLLAADGEAFLRFAMPRRFGGFTQTIQTDGGSEFEAEFAKSARLFCRQHRIARPYKKNEQSFIESFNRTVRQECLGWDKYRPEELPELTNLVEAFLEHYYYHRPHLAFQPMRPRPHTGLKSKRPLRDFYGNIAQTGISGYAAKANLIREAIRLYLRQPTITLEATA